MWSDGVRGRAGGTGRAIAGAGRRPGPSDTRARILVAAREGFGERGFEGTTIRSIAARAEVDPALVHHYFGSKQQLFVTAMEFPVDVAAMIPKLLDGPPDTLGERLVGYVLDLWEGPAARPLLVGLLRSASSDPVAAGMMRRYLSEGPVLALAKASDRPDASIRDVLAGSQLIGLALARYVVQVEPLASAPRDLLVRTIGPTIQRYLVGDLDERGPSRELARRPAGRPPQSR